MKQKFERLDVGATYLSRDGNRVKILYHFDDENFKFQGDDRRVYMENGKWWIPLTPLISTLYGWLNCRKLKNLKKP